MHCSKTLIPLIAAALIQAADFSGAAALEFTRRAVALGPRPSGSPAHAKLQAMIVSELKRSGAAVEEHAFVAKTPAGDVPMKNIIGKFGGSSRRLVVFSGHYETKRFEGMRFTGANDGGSSTGFLLEMARALQGRPHKDAVYLVFFDGEEAFGEWSDTDGLYGSRELARRWSRDGTIGLIRALINVDMIGDKDLGILQEFSSTPWLRQLVWRTAQEKGYGRYFLSTGADIADDHAPFLRLGVAAVDLIDFDYPPWHTAADTMDKLSAHSFQVVGDVLLALLGNLENQGQ